MQQTKLVVVGAGHVGSQAVTACSYLNLFTDIVIIDKIKPRAAGEALDQRHALPALYRTNTTLSAGTYADCADADIILIAAAVGEQEPDRMAMGKQNALQIRSIMDQITRYTNEAIIILITNPVDAITYIAETEYNYPKGKIFGTGTALDSFRLRKIIGDLYGVDSRAVSGFILGEHGTTAFPVPATITLGGIPLEQAGKMFSLQTPLSMEAVAQEVVRSAYDVFEWKGWTNAAIGEVAASLARSVMLDEKMIYPVTAVIDGLYGFNGEVAFSTPAVIGRGGLEKQLELSLTAAEKEKLQHCANVISMAVQSYQ